MKVLNWIRALGCAFIDPIEHHVCPIRVSGFAILAPWLIAAIRTAVALHPHLRAIGESGGAVSAAVGAGLGIKRWAQGKGGTLTGPPGTDIEEHP